MLVPFEGIATVLRLAEKAALTREEVEEDGGWIQFNEEQKALDEVHIFLTTMDYRAEKHLAEKTRERQGFIRRIRRIFAGAALLVALAIAAPAEARTCKVQGLVNADCSIVVPPIPPANPPPLPPPASQRIVPQPKYWRS